MVAPESEKKVAAMFDRIAPTYDFLNRLLSARQDERWRRQMLAWVPRIKDGSFCDVATGTGDVVLRAHKNLSSYKKFSGVDISTEMLAIAKKKAASRDADISFGVMSAENLEFEDNSFDCLTISFGLRNVVDKAKAIHEFARVLRPGGAFLVLEFFPPSRGFFSSMFQFYFHKILPFIGSIFSDKEAYAYLPKSVESFYSFIDFKLACEKAGLSVTRHKTYLFGSCRLIKVIKTV